MRGEQLNLFDVNTHINNKYITDKPVDVSTLLPGENIMKNRYFIYPTGGKHPYANFDEALNTNDYPFIEDRNYRLMGERRVVGVMVRDRISYPVVNINKNSITQYPSGNHRIQKSICVHKLIARAFLNPGNLDPYNNSVVIDHIDNKPWNYRLNNLRFVTRSENGKGWKKISNKEIFDIAKLNKRF